MAPKLLVKHSNPKSFGEEIKQRGGLIQNTSAGVDDSSRDTWYETA